jgi:hypothetical protein
VAVHERRETLHLPGPNGLDERAIVLPHRL